MKTFLVLLSLPLLSLSIGPQPLSPDPKEPVKRNFEQLNFILAFYDITGSDKQLNFETLTSPQVEQNARAWEQNGVWQTLDGAIGHDASWPIPGVCFPLRDIASVAVDLRAYDTNLQPKQCFPENFTVLYEDDKCQRFSPKSIGRKPYKNSQSDMMWVENAKTHWKSYKFNTKLCKDKLIKAPN